MARNTCDHCGPAVAAPLIVSLSNGGTLTFCRHCIGVFRPKLEAEDAWIFDEEAE